MDWESHYLDNHTPWDKGAAAPPLLEWLEANPTLISGDILVPGSGKGHDGAALAERTAASRVVGLDISPSAAGFANATHQTERFHTQTGDLFQLPAHHHSAFDWVWEHTCFCAIDLEMRDAYVEAVHFALKPGGNLLGVFYRNPYDDEHQPGGGPPHGTSNEEIVSRFVGSGFFEIVESYVPSSSYKGREELEQLIRMKRL
ncbi:MAG: methyltransferase domain-containing protein [Verrucomicrobiales bacterium]|nr:methyltransferase domain-containing protein [Verrucomicrobiales bacterium]